MLAVIYARYSDSKQREESIEGQLKVCHEYAQANGFSVIHEYADRAKTGRSDDRYQFQKMLKDAEKKQFDTVIIYSSDRFGRQVRQVLNNINKLTELGVSVRSATEKYDDSPYGSFANLVKICIDQFYSDDLTQKVKRGMDVNAEKCLSNGGTTPLGYRIQNHKYVLDPQKAPIVKEIYTKYAGGWSAKQICDNLNERHIKTAKGAQFNKSSLHVLLKNRKYLGIYKYKDIEVAGGMPRIIDDALFEKVQDKMKLNKQAPARARAKAEYLLTTKLYCGYCKSMMIGHSSNQISTKGVIYNYYKCKNSGARKPCKKKMIMKNYIEDVVVEECKKLLTPKNINRIANEVVKISAQNDDVSEQKRLEGELKTAEREKENQMTALRQCSSDEVRKMFIIDLEKLAAEIKELERQIEIEKSRHYVLTKEQVVQRLTALSKGDIKDTTYRRTLIKLFVNKIFLYDNKFTITFTTGDDEVEITDALLSKIESEKNRKEGTSFCLSNVVAHQKRVLSFDKTLFSMCGSRMTSNFCGPQFVGMWREKLWHKEMTATIHSAELGE